MNCGKQEKEKLKIAFASITDADVFSATLGLFFHPVSVKSQTYPLILYRNHQSHPQSYSSHNHLQFLLILMPFTSVAEIFL